MWRDAFNGATLNQQTHMCMNRGQDLELNEFRTCIVWLGIINNCSASCVLRADSAG